jgi:flagellar basal body-associated protein FliL
MRFSMSPQYQFHDQHLANITNEIAGYTVYTVFATTKIRIEIMVTRTARTPAAKAAPARKPAAKTATKPATLGTVLKPEKKHKKEKKSGDKVKVVRDSFTMPQSDYALIAALKEKANGLHLKKSELLRAGLRLLSKLTAAQLNKSVADLEKIKTGRPKKA